MDTANTGTSSSQPLWDVVIAPSSPWWKLQFGEIWRYRDLLRELVARDLTAQYKQTILGPVWLLLQPLLTSIMFAVVFGIMARMSLAGVPPLLFYMSGVVPWAFFSGVINKTSSTLTNNAALMTKVYFPRLVPPLATMTSTAVGFLIQLGFFLCFALFYQFTGTYVQHAHLGMLMLPVLIGLIVLLAFGMGLIVAAMTTKYRDLGYLIGFGIQLLMYMSPVIFPLARVDEGSKLRSVIEANPITPVIEGFRSALIGSYVDWATLWYPFVVGIVLLLGGLALFQRVERTYADVV